MSKSSGPTNRPHPDRQRPHSFPQSWHWELEKTSRRPKGKKKRRTLTFKQPARETDLDGRHQLNSARAITYATGKKRSPERQPKRLGGGNVRDPRGNNRNGHSGRGCKRKKLQTGRAYTSGSQTNAACRVQRISEKGRTLRPPARKGRRKVTLNPARSF